MGEGVTIARNQSKSSAETPANHYESVRNVDLSERCKEPKPILKGEKRNAVTEAKYSRDKDITSRINCKATLPKGSFRKPEPSILQSENSNLSFISFAISMAISYRILT